MAHLSPPPSPPVHYNKFSSLEHIKMDRSNPSSPTLMQRSAFAAELGHKWNTHGKFDTFVKRFVTLNLNYVLLPHRFITVIQSISLFKSTILASTVVSLSTTITCSIAIASITQP